MSKVYLILSYVCFAALYVAAAKLGFWLSGGTWSNITPVWPPTGIALAVLFLGGYRYWPAVMLGAFTANIVWTPAPLLTAVLIAIGNTLEAVCGTCLVKKFDRNEVLSTVHGVFIFIMCASVLGTVVSASIGVGASLLGGMLKTEAATAAWFTWWLGDLVGALVVTPLCISFSKRPWEKMNRAALMEFALLQITACGLGVFIFSRTLQPNLSDYALTYTIFPYLIWASVRFELSGASVTTFLASCVAIWGTTRGSGPYANSDPGGSLMMLMAFIGVAAVTSLFLAVALSERRRAEAKIRELNLELERRVDERTAALHTSQEKLRHSERLASIGTLASGIAHEINNPAASILATAQLALEKLSDANAVESARKSLAVIADEAKRCGWIVKNLLQFARMQKLEKSPENLNAIVERAAKATRDYAHKHGTSLKFELDPLLPNSTLNPTAMEQVVVNLIRNAIEAGQAGTNVLVQTVTGRQEVRLIVSDNGPGLSAEMKQRILDPFFTTRVGSGGTGLGLSICHGIVTQHSGTIEIESDIGLGTRVIIALPLWAEKSVSENSQAEARSGTRNSR